MDRGTGCHGFIVDGNTSPVNGGPIEREDDASKSARLLAELQEREAPTPSCPPRKGDENGRQKGVDGEESLERQKHYAGKAAEYQAKVDAEKVRSAAILNPRPANWTPESQSHHGPGPGRGIYHVCQASL